MLRLRRVDAAAVKGWAGTGATQLRMPLPQVSTDHFLEILVEDRGIGIAPEDADRLFRMFSQVDSSMAKEVEGTGLGLVLIDQLARLAGGTVALTSTPGEGTSFFVWLPWRDAEAPDVQEARVFPASALSNEDRLTALVIEDNKHAAELIRLQLEPEGFSVVRAASARAALDWLHDGPPHLIVLDLLLPDMDGWDLLSQLKQPGGAAAHVPVVVVSIVADANKGLALGATAVLQKPFSRDEMRAALDEAGFSTQPAEQADRLVGEVHRALAPHEGVAP